MAQVSVTKNHIRIAVMMFQEMLWELMQVEPLKRRKEFILELNRFEKEVWQKTQKDSKDRKIKKKLKEVKRKILSVIDESMTGNKVDALKLQQNCFGGQIISNPHDFSKLYDLAVLVEKDQVKPIVFCPSVNDHVSNQEIEEEIVKDFGKNSLSVSREFSTADLGEPDTVIIAPTPSEPNTVVNTPSLQSPSPQNNLLPVVSTLPPVPTLPNLKTVMTNPNTTNPNNNQQKPNIGNSNQPTILGRIIQSKPYPIKLETKTENNRIYGFIDEKCTESVRPNSYVTVESPNKEILIFCRSEKAKSTPEHATIGLKGASGTTTLHEFWPFKEFAPDHVGDFRAKQDGINGWIIRDLADEEVPLAFNVPEVGLPIGELILHDSNTLGRLP